MTTLIVIAIIVLLIYFLSFNFPHSDLIVQIENEEQVDALREHLKQAGVSTYAKNMKSQGLISRKGGALGYPSLHVVNQNDLSRAIELAKEYLAE